MNLLNNRLGRLAALLAVGGVVAFAQGTQTANITGHVVDSTGANLSGVNVRLTSPALQGVRTYVTGSDGRFIARLLPPGEYTITLTKDGLETRKVQQRVGVDQTFSPRITMTSSAAAVVQVVAAAPAVDKTDVKTATNYRMSQVDELPTANRAMETVALLTPAVTTGVGGRVQIAGAMTSGNLFLLDGQNIADSTYNDRGVAVIDDSIEETQVITGAISAEYGDVDGGVINAITKSGGNDFTASLRWELSNPDWNAVAPYQNRAEANLLGETKTLNITGPILIDKLWFSASYFTTKTNNTGTIGYDLSSDPFGVGASNPAAGNDTGFGSNYTTGHNEIRRQAKLTYSINQNHTLVASYMRNETDDVNRNYYAGEQAALVNQKTTSAFVNLDLMSTWAPNFTTEIRYGHKQERLTAGGLPNGQSPIYSDETGGFYNNGIFDSADGGDNRNNNTANFKASLFWDGLGSHQTDMGIDYTDEVRQAQNQQSPTGLIFEAAGVNLVNRTAIPTAVWTFYPVTGATNNYSYGLYVNDKWSLNEHWNYQIGLRWDKYEAKNENGNQTATANGLSPRLGATYDLFGDSKHIFKLSYARYNAKVLETVTGAVSGVGNPKEIDYYANSFLNAGGNWLTSDALTFAALQNLALYNVGNPANVAYYNDPLLNVKLNPNLKAPTVDEFQGSYAYSYDFGAWGSGYVKVTGTYKNWKNLVDYSNGNNGTVTDPTGAVLYVRVWDNNPNAKRTYRDLVLEGQYKNNGWTVNGNITWSSLKGNYEGEGTYTPGSGQGLDAWNVQNGVAMFDSGVIHPYGYLTGEDPIRMRFMAAKAYENSWGKTTIGYIYRFDAGSHFSIARTISRKQLNPALSSQFGASSTQYYNNTWGQGVFPSEAYLDMSITQDFPLIKIGGRTVWAFGKLVIQNIFNHQQQIGWNTTYNSATGTYPNATSSPWVQSANYGTAFSSAYYGQPRTIVASAGIRF